MLTIAYLSYVSRQKYLPQRVDLLEVINQQSSCRSSSVDTSATQLFARQSRDRTTERLANVEKL